MSIQKTEDGSGFLIVDVVPEGPAAEAGIQIQDLLTRVGETDIRHMTMEEVGNLVKGAEGTSVCMTVFRQGTHETLFVQRRKVKTPVATYEMLDDNIGLVTIENFDDRCAEESIAAIETLLEQGAEKLIFDVRFNPGGFASELVELLDYLLPEGELFRTIRYDGEEYVDTSDADCLDIPMAVLVNGSSYSAAEFFAAALQEYEAAVVVGEPTVGKGYCQTTYQLSDGSAVSLSIGKYFTPKGISLEAEGITPDVLELVEEEVAAQIYYGILPPEEDPHIQAAIRVLN
jgi:carboxyl-terminal processing protease